MKICAHKTPVPSCLHQVYYLDLYNNNKIRYNKFTKLAVEKIIIQWLSKNKFKNK